MWWYIYSFRVVPEKSRSIGKSGISLINTLSGLSHVVRHAVHPFGASIVSTRAAAHVFFAYSMASVVTPSCFIGIIWYHFFHHNWWRGVWENDDAIINPTQRLSYASAARLVAYSPSVWKSLCHAVGATNISDFESVFWTVSNWGFTWESWKARSLLRTVWPVPAHPSR